LERNIFENEPLKHDRFFRCIISSCNEKEGSQGDEDVDVIFILVVIVWVWIAGKFMGIPSMIPIWMILEGKVQIFCFWSSHL
jgi:hypothetical protein